MDDRPIVTTFLFTDIEGSTRLWEHDPGRMRDALARHDALARTAIEAHRGTMVKSTGDGVHAAFDDPADGVAAALAIQRGLADPSATAGLALSVRCGLHAGVIERRDNDYFGAAVNRAARIMGIAHGGQVLVSQAVADLVHGRLPADCSLRDLGTVRLRDLSGPERVFQVVHPFLRADFPALRTLEATPNNLPRQLTSFVGRERELAELRALLRTARLLTLCGTGGLGKSRLSVQVAAESLGEYADGVWFVDLAPVADPRLVPQAAASVLGVKEEAGRPVSEALARFAQERSILLILDNCEHVVDAAAALASQLLRAATGVKLIATSREALRVQGEAVYPVPSLGVPDAARDADLASVAQSGSVQLFVDRAASVQHGFRLSEGNARQVVEICRRLDGIPLAIELAAARMRALPLDAIAERLDDLFRLLASGDRAAMPRQRTLRALIDWSHDLLGVKEQALFRRLAVFAGGWTIEAAEDVCAGGALARDEVLDALTSLAEKSLVAVDHETGRYRLLETVRQYAVEKLRSAGEEGATRSRHLDFFLAVAERVRRAATGPAHTEGFARLDRDHENVLAAATWSIHAAADPSLAWRLVHAMKNYWFGRGMLNLASGLMGEAVACGADAAPTASRALAFFDAGQVAAYMGRYGEALRHLEGCLALARSLGDEAMLVSVLQPLALAALGHGERAAAKRYSEEGLALARKLGNPVDVAGAANALAQVHRMQGDLDLAEPLYAETVMLSRGTGHRENLATGLLNLAMVAVARCATDRAREMLLEVLSIAADTGWKPAGLCALEVSAALAAASKDWVSAARLFGIAEAQARTFGIQRDPADDAFLQPYVATARQALGEAAWGAAIERGANAGYAEAVEELRAWLGERAA